MSSPPQSRTLRTNLTSAAVERLRWPPVLAIALVWAAFAALVQPASAADDRVRLRDVTARLVERADRSPQRAPDGAGTTRPSARREIPLLTPDPAQLRRAKARAARRLPSGPAPSPQTFSPLPKASVFGGLNKPGMAAEELSGTPPDTTGAIGPSHYLEFVNSVGITAYDRNLEPVSGPVPLEEFIGFPEDAVFDPQIQWDANWDRWIYVMDDIENPETPEEENFLAFGWSKTADPTNLSTGPAGGWCGYFLETGALFDDYPKLGHSDAGITIGTNVFTTTFLGSRIWSIAKPSNPGTCPGFGEAGLTVGVSGLPLLTEDGDIAFTPVPANTADSSANSYVVAADSPFFTADSEVMAWHISGAGEGAPLVEDGNMEVGFYEFPGNVPQEGTAEVLDSLDTRLTNAVAVTDPDAGQEAVWTQHTIDGPGGRSVVRWYELLPATQTVRQEGTISDPEHFVFNAAISPAVQGDSAAIDFNRGGATLFPEMHAQSRHRDTPLGQMEGDVPLGASGGVAQDFSCGGVSEPCRWGDYAGASPDPVLPGVVWGSNQGLAAPSGEFARWTTRNFALLTDQTAPAAPTIVATDPPSPANDNNPKLKGNAEVGSTVRLFASTDCSGLVAAQGSAAAFAFPGLVVAVPDNSTTQFTATATDPAGNTSPCSGAFAYTESTPPPPQVVGPPPPPPPGTAIASKLALVKGGAALLRMRCLGTGPCRGVARLVVRVKAPKGAKSSKKRARNVVIGKAGFSIAAGKSKVVRVALTGLGKALVRKAGKRGVRAKLRGSGLVPRAVKLKPPARKRK